MKISDPLLLARGLVLLVWLLTLVALLKLGDYFLEDNYSLCGPWGCGPSTGSVLAVQLAWTVALLPPLWALTPWLGGLARQRYFALGLLLAGLLGIAFTAAWQQFVWLPEVGSWGQPYLWQRIGYTILTWVEYPMLQLSLAGLLLAANSLQRPRRTGFVDAAAQVPSTESSAAFPSPMTDRPCLSTPVPHRTES